MNLQEYRMLLEDFIVSCFGSKTGGKYVKAEGEARVKQDKILAGLDHFEKNNPKYIIVCDKACYVGQGIDFAPGDVIESYHDPVKAFARLNQMNNDPWAQNCFIMGYEDFP